MAECNTCDECFDIRPCLSLEEWRRIMCFSPYGFWQWGQDAGTRIVVGGLNGQQPNMVSPIAFDVMQPCGNLVYDEGYQSNNDGLVGRNEVWRVLIQAEQAFAAYGGYNPCPNYSVAEISFKDWYCNHKLRLPLAKLTRIGKRTVTYISDGIPVISDTDFDQINDTVTITVARGHIA